MKTPAATEVTTSAQDKRHFTRRLLDSASRLIDNAVGGDFQRLLNLLAAVGFSAGVAFALALVEAFK